MGKIVDPKQFGISGRAVIKEISKKHFAIVIDRKSRIIMSDGKKILEKANKIKKAGPGLKVSLQTSAPLCSKTEAFLSEKNIDIIQ